MRVRRVGWLVALAVVASSCAAAVPSVDDLEIRGAVRFVAEDGAVVSAGSERLPMLVQRRNEICSGDVSDRFVTGDRVDQIEAAPLVELALDCVDFAPQVVFPVWSPDSTKVAFMGVSQGAESDVWIYDTTAGAVTNVSGDAGEDTLPLWLDDSTLVFVRSEDEEGFTRTTIERVSTESAVPRTVATIRGSIDLGNGATIVRGNPARAIVNLRGQDGEILGVHAVDLVDGEITPLYVPDPELADDGFRLLDIHDDGTLALAVTGAGGLESGTSSILLIDLDTGNEETVEPRFGTDIGDVRFSSDGVRILVWELGTERGDALVIRSIGSDEDAEVLLYGELGRLDVVEGGATVDIGTALALVTIES